MDQPQTPDLRFAVIASDVVSLTLRNNELFVRLTLVNRPPHYVNTPGLPGGLIHPNETAEAAAKRHLAAKAEIEHVTLEQLYTFSEVNRDQRGRVVAVAYLALAAWGNLSTSEQADSESSWWCPVNKATNLAYDHNEMLALAIERLRSRVTYTTIIHALLPQAFTLTELENAYSAILGTSLDKRNFRKKILKLNILKALAEKRTGERSRPAQLYTFVSSKTENIAIL